MVQNVSGKGTSTAKPLIKGYDLNPVMLLNWKNIILAKMDCVISEEQFFHL